MKYKYLESVRGELEKCVKCAACQAGCPTYESSFSETLSARGKIHLLDAVLNGRLELSERIQADLSMCLSCLNCKTVCPANVDTQKIFTLSLNQVNIEKGASAIEGFIYKHILPFPGRLSVLSKIVGICNLFYSAAPGWLVGILPYSRSGVKRVTPDFLSKNLRSALNETYSAKGEAQGGSIQRVAYFSGCMTDLAFSTTGESVVTHLRFAGLEVVFPKNQVCCGAPAFFGGDNAAFLELAEQNIKAFSDLDVDAIVCSCATCASVLSHAYADLDGDNKGSFVNKIVDFQQLLIALGMDSIYSGMEKGGRKLRVTYHDPCHLKRGMGVSGQPRTLIKSLPNVEFVEMENADRCCGGAGTFSVKHYDEAIDFGLMKAESIAASGADYVMTSCPSCQLQITDALNRYGLNIPVISGPELMDLTLPQDDILNGEK